MKLVEQRILVFQAGASEKVYEIDLCEVGADRYVVNFRYGRRGGLLKDGSKTVVGVPLAEARSAFEKLIQSKLEQGYVLASSPSGPAVIPTAPATATTPATTPHTAPGSTTGTASRPPTTMGRIVSGAPTTTGRSGAESTGSTAGSAAIGIGTGTQPSIIGHAPDDRARRVLERLSRGDSSRGWFRRGRDPWPFDRAIWRAGELRIGAAVPLLIQHIGTSTPLRDYCIIFALGRIGGSESVRMLERLQQSRLRSDALRRILLEALRNCLPSPQREAFLELRFDEIPPVLRDLARRGPAAAFAEALNAHLRVKDARAWAVIDFLYLIDNAHVRPAILEIARSAPLRPPAFQRLRHLFKAAELRRDAELFGILAHRFEKTRAMYRTPRYGNRVRLEDGTTARTTTHELASADARLAYSSDTRAYLRGRAWRTLRTLGRDGDADYVKIAVGVLLPFTDADGVTAATAQSAEAPASVGAPGDDAWSRYWAFNHILYGRSRSRTADHRQRRWRDRLWRRPDRPLTPVREEAFPALWERNPAGLLMLLDESRCEPVHRFAVRILRDRPELCAMLDVDAIVMLLSRPYPDTAALGFDLARRRYDPVRPDRALLLAVAHCVHGPARLEAQRWIDAQRSIFLNDTSLIADLLSGPQADTRVFVRDLVRDARLTGDAARALAGRLIATLLGLPGQAGPLAEDLALTLRETLSGASMGVGEAVLRDLLAHPLPAVQALAGHLLLQDALAGALPPEALLRRLLASDHLEVRVTGVALLDRLPIASLRGYEALVVALVASPLEDVHTGVRPVLRKLLHGDPVRASAVADTLIATLLDRLEDTVYRHVARVLLEDLEGAAAHIPPETVWRLLQAKSTAVQEVGGRLLIANVDPASLEIDQIARLADHDILAVRQAAWSMYERTLPRLKRAMASAIRILDAKWDDARAFAFAFFRERFDPEDFTPEVLIAICDSIRSDVQQLGRELITRHFAEEDGWTYLARLSEHPSPALQLLATSYLERFAAGQPERLEQLAVYLTTVLGQVNRGRVAKARVLEFLEQEGLKSEAAARVVAGMLERQSATIAKTYRARVLEILVRLHCAYPAVPVPIRVIGPEVRHGV